MRMGLIGLVLGFLWACLWAGLGPARRGRADTPVRAGEAQAAPWDRTVMAALSPGEMALSHSLWADGVGAMCRVPTRYSARLVAVRFGDLMRMSLDAARETPVIEIAAPAIAAAWTGQGRASLTATSDADIASRLVTIARGSSPVVRLIKSRPMRPRRMTMGAETPLAA